MEAHIKMLPVQKEFFYAEEPFVAIVSARSCGKSWIAIFSALVDLLNGRNVLYMAQTDGAFYKGPWIHLQTFLRDYNLLDRWSYNSTYKTGTLGESKFYFASYENIDAARGATECSTLYLDEFMLSNPNEVLAVTAPCLRGKDHYGNPIKPKIRAVSTPNMQSLWQLMMVEHEKYGIRLLRSKMTDNVFITDEQREVMASAIFDEKLRRQELEGEIILGEDATALISLKDFPTSAPYCSDDRVYAGLDMAHTGQRDSHVFAAIKGNQLLAFHEFGICDAMAVAKYIRDFNKVYPIHHMNVDLAWSESIYDQIKYEIRTDQISFAQKAPDEESQRQYANIRAYGYFRLAKMHKHGLCVDFASPWIDDGLVSEYKREITNTHFIMDKQGRLLIEPKEDIKTRISRSPDPADSLMLAAMDRAFDDPAVNQVQTTEARRQQQARWARMMQ